MLAGAEVVVDDDLVAVGDQAIGQVAADEARAARDEGALHAAYPTGWAETPWRRSTTARDHRPRQGPLPGRAGPHSQVLQHLESNDVRVPRAEAGGLGTESGGDQRPLQRARLEEADVDLGDDVVPPGQVRTVGAGVAGGEEQETGRSQQVAEGPQERNRIGHVLDHLDCGHDVERPAKRQKRVGIHDGDTGQAQALERPSLLLTHRLAANVLAEVRDQAAGAAAGVEPARLRTDGSERADACGDAAPLVAADGAPGGARLEGVVHEGVGARAAVVVIGVDPGRVGRIEPLRRTRIRRSGATGRGQESSCPAPRPRAPSAHRTPRSPRADASAMSAPPSGPAAAAVLNHSPGPARARSRPTRRRRGTSSPCRASTRRGSCRTGAAWRADRGSR